MQIDAVNGMQQALRMFDRSAAETVAAAAAITGPAPGAVTDAPDLAAGITGMMSARLAYTAAARVVQFDRDRDRVLLDLLA